MSDTLTPRTDEWLASGTCEPWSCCRVLEQELAEATDELEAHSWDYSYSMARAKIEQLTRERDEARAALREAIEAFGQIAKSRFYVAQAESDEMARWRKAAGQDQKEV